MKTNTFEISSTQLLEKLKSFSKQDYEKYNPIVLYGNSGTGMHTAFKKGHWSVEKGTIGAQKRTA